MSYYVVWIDEEASTGGNCQSVGPGSRIEPSIRSRLRSLVEAFVSSMTVQVPIGDHCLAVIVEDDAP